MSGVFVREPPATLAAMLNRCEGHRAMLGSDDGLHTGKQALGVLDRQAERCR
jgi:hypothetical protein